MYKFPANSTHLVQPLDNFIIREIKRLWKTVWQREKKDRILQNDYRQQSGKINHPSRHWYMSTAKTCIDKINEMRDQNGLLLTRKSMIRCGPSFDINGIWRISQLSNDLQDTVTTYIENFNGVPPFATA